MFIEGFLTARPWGNTYVGNMGPALSLWSKKNI